MSLTLNPPTRLTALIGALVLTGLAAVVFLLGRGALGAEQSVSAEPAQVAKSAPRVAASSKPATVPRVQARADSGFPRKIDHALRYNRVVVVSVSLPGAAVDAVVRREARSGAKAARAGFVAISAANERAISGLVAKTGVLPAPAVLIVKRPGVVAGTFSVTDSGTISQAVAQARR